MKMFLVYNHAKHECFKYHIYNLNQSKVKEKAKMP